MSSTTGFPELDWIGEILTGHASDVQADLGRPTQRTNVVDSLAVLPSARKARLLISTEAPRVLSKTLERSARGTQGRERWLRRALAYASKAGAGRLLVRDRLFLSARTGTSTPDATLLAHLRAMLSALAPGDLEFAVTTGPLRPNRKPVVSLMSGNGDLVAFAKVGCDTATKALIHNEAGRLGEFARHPLRGIKVPELIHTGTWNDLELLVMSALPSAAANADGPRTPPFDAARAVREYETNAMARLHASKYWAGLIARVVALPDSFRAPTQDLLGRIEAALGDITISTGFCHGDWAPWNMAQTDDGLYVWDWERARGSVPVGFDLSHWYFQTAYAGGKLSVAEAAASARAALKTTATHEGNSDDVAVMFDLYLTELLIRYLESSLVKAPELTKTRKAIVDELERSLDHTY